MKQKPSFKRVKKSPVVSFEVVHIAPPAPPSPAPVAPSQTAQESKALRQETEKTIAKQLGEAKAGARMQIGAIVKKLGSQEALALLQETQGIEEKGGMMLPDNSRRRTPGGVFFFLVRRKYPDAMPQVDWKELRAKKKAKKMQVEPEQRKDNEL